MEVINFNQVEPTAVVPQVVAQTAGITRAEISRCEYFVVEKVSLAAGAVYRGETDGSTLEIWGTVDGAANLSTPNGDTVALPTIRFCLIPAAQGKFAITAAENTTMLRAYLP